MKKTEAPICPRCKSKRMIPMGRSTSGRVRWACKNQPSNGKRGYVRTVYCYVTTNPDVPPRDQGSNTIDQGPEHFSRKLRPVKRFIVTCAQNSTPRHKGFFSNLLAYAKHVDAELIVIPLRYKNPTSRWTKSQENADVWDTELQPYLLNTRVKLNKSLVLLGDIRVQPTAVEPLNGFEAITAGESAILGHTKLSLRSVATPANKRAKILTTTGACTLPNYTDSRAGKTGEFHHAMAALIVEVDGDEFWIRQLNGASKSGAFTDLDVRVDGGKVRKAPRPLALVEGDKHIDSIDPGVEHATYGKGGIVPVLKPKHLIYHDTLDMYSGNPHHGLNPFNRLAKRNTDRDNVAAEVKRAIDYLREHQKFGAKIVVVPSNHDDMLKRWIVSTDWRNDPVNAIFYLKTALYMAENTKMSEIGTEAPDPFKYWIEKELPGVRHLSGESFVLGGVELAMHGDRGPNGARGSIKNLRRIGLRSIIGHSHSPGISEGAFQTGTSSYLKLEYNGGPSSWLHAHVVLHADGKRQLIVISDGRWRL